MRRSTSRPRSGASAAPVLKNRARHSDRDATEGPKRCDHSCRRPHLGALRCKLLGHSDIRACCGTNPFAYPPGSNSSASSQASVGQRVKSASSPVAFCAPSASVNRQRTFDEAKWASQLCWEPNETAAVDGAGSAEGSLEIVAPVVDDPLARYDVDDSQMRKRSDDQLVPPMEACTCRLLDILTAKLTFSVSARLSHEVVCVAKRYTTRCGQKTRNGFVCPF